MEKSLNSVNTNNSYHIDINSIKTFGDRIIEENNKLVDIMTKMYDDSVQYDDMVNNKAGNLYKEVMLRELQKEKEKIINNNDVISKTFTDIYNAYNDAITTTNNSVRG